MAEIAEPIVTASILGLALCDPGGEVTVTNRNGAGIAVLAVLALALASWSLLRAEHDSDAYPVGHLADYPPDIPVAVEIDHAYFDRFLPESPTTDVDSPRSVSKTNVWIVNRLGTEPLVLLQRSPRLGCRVIVASLADAIGFGHTPPQDFEAGFIDPCHGGLYSIGGQRLAGPGSANLSRFPVRIDSDGTLLVDLTDLAAG